MREPSHSVLDEGSAKVPWWKLPSLGRIQPQAWALILLSVLLQIGSFPVAGPLPYWRSGLAWVALVPFLVALLLPAKNGEVISTSGAFLLGYACGIAWYAGNCYWIYQTMYLYGGLPKPVALFILFLFALYLGLYHALFGYLVARVRRARAGVMGALLLIPFLWVAVELARGRVTGFPWDLLGNSQIDNRLVTGIAPLAGVMGISFLLAAVNACFAAPFVVRSQRSLMLAAGGLVVAGLLVGFGLTGAGKLNSQQPLSYAVLMQENLSVGATARGTRPVNAADELVTFSALSLHPGLNSALELPAGAQPSLIVWPEAPSHFRSDDPNLQQKLG